jgi:hypothetical protein
MPQDDDKRAPPIPPRLPKTGSASLSPKDDDKRAPTIPPRRLHTSAASSASAPPRDVLSARSPAPSTSATVHRMLLIDSDALHQVQYEPGFLDPDFMAAGNGLMNEGVSISVFVPIENDSQSAVSDTAGPSFQLKLLTELLGEGYAGTDSPSRIYRHKELFQRIEGRYKEGGNFVVVHLVRARTKNTVLSG